MVLEATVIILDNSEWMRNEDYSPSRLEAQSDAAMLLFNAKRQSNLENSVGLLTMSGLTPKVLMTLTTLSQPNATLSTDQAKFMAAMSAIRLEGQANLASALQVAQLVLKYRQNKNQRQRIVAFIGSPLPTSGEKASEMSDVPADGAYGKGAAKTAAEEEKEDELVRIAKQLKKNGVALDIVDFGSEATLSNAAQLENLIDAVSSNDNSHLVRVPPGKLAMSDVLMSSANFLFTGGDDDGSGTSRSMAMTDTNGVPFEFGIDPNMDPELVLALRMSLEEEQARQAKAKAEAEAAQLKQQATNENDPASSVAAATLPSGALASSMEDVTMASGDALADQDYGDDNDDMLAHALALSMETAHSEAKPASSGDGSNPAMDKKPEPQSKL